MLLKYVIDPKKQRWFDILPIYTTQLHFKKNQYNTTKLFLQKKKKTSPIF